jgi:hypothetical protein
VEPDADEALEEESLEDEGKWTRTDGSDSLRP